MIAEEGKAGRKIGERWSAILVPSPAASNNGGIQTKIARIICVLGTIGCTFIVFLGFRRRGSSA
jgi:hypothetical protein